MIVSRAIVALTALAASVASAIAAPAPHAFWRGPVAMARHGGEFHMFRRGDRFPGLALGAIAPDNSPSGFETEAAPLSIFAAPFSLTVSFAPAAGPGAYEGDGPRLIEIAPARPGSRLPLVIYGNPGA